MRWYTAIGMKKDDADGRFCVWVDGEEKVLTEMETILWAALTWSFCEEDKVHSQMHRLLVFSLGEKQAQEWADKEDFQFCLNRLVKRGLVVLTEGCTREEAVYSIQRYGILSLFILLFGSFMGTWMKDKTFIFWSFLLGIIGFIRTYLIFRTADKKTYEIVEGLVTGIDGKNPFARLRKIRVSDPAGRQSELLLDKNVKVLEGKRYRFYFGINEKKLVGIRRVDAALNNGTFLGNEEI